MTLKELTEKLATANDAISQANDLSDQTRVQLLQQLNLLLVNLILALVAKNS